MTVRAAIFLTLRIQARHCSTTTVSKLPGPKALPLIGHAHLFGPLGPYSAERLVEAHADLFRKYGPVVGIHLGTPMVLLFNPDDVATMFRGDDKWPQRPPFDALRHYRRSKPARYRHLGLVTDNGAGWYALRRAISWLLKPPSVKLYFDPLSAIASDFAHHLQRVNEKDGTIKNFIQEATRYSQEAIGYVCFGERLGCLSEEFNPKTDEITEVNNAFLDSMARTLLGLPWWKIFKTPTYKKLAASEDFMWKIASSFLSSAVTRLAADPAYGERIPFLRHLLEQPELDSRDISLIMAEVFFGGIDATATTLTMCLFHLANNPKAQEKLVEEIKSTELKSRDDFDKMPYLRACLKETLRLTPTAVGNGRITSKELTLQSGHRIPAKTLMISCHPVISTRENVFGIPEQFRPGRWLRGTLVTLPHPFASLPFGFGPRMCPGKRIAEQEILLALVKILSKFRIHSVGPKKDIRMTMRLNLVPDRPLHFRLEERSENEN